MKYSIIRTDTFDLLLNEMMLYIANNFGVETALKKLDEIEGQVMLLGEHPEIGTAPRYLVLKQQGYRALILEKDIVLYKTDETRKTVTLHAIVDMRQDYLDIIKGL